MKLYPWQKEILDTIKSGKKIVFYPGFRYGKRTLLNESLKEQRSQMSNIEQLNDVVNNALMIIKGQARLLEVPDTKTAKIVVSIQDQVTRAAEALIEYNAKERGVIDNCPHCGCTEMLCGHNGPGCNSEYSKSNNQRSNKFEIFVRALVDPYLMTQRDRNTWVNSGLKMHKGGWVFLYEANEEEDAIREFCEAYPIEKREHFKVIIKKKGES